MCVIFNYLFWQLLSSWILLSFKRSEFKVDPVFWSGSCSSEDEPLWSELTCWVWSLLEAAGHIAACRGLQRSVMCSKLFLLFISFHRLSVGLFTSESVMLHVVIVGISWNPVSVPVSCSADSLCRQIWHWSLSPEGDNTNLILLSSCLLSASLSLTVSSFNGF